MPHPYWAYGVTTVPERAGDLLPNTLASLALAGFDSPRLFVDGAKDGFDNFGFDVTYHYPRILTFGNWILALAELYIRSPHAQRYAIFQDDLICCRNLKTFLELTEYPAKSYLNLYTFPENQSLYKGDERGWKATRQTGRGAVALVFNRDAVIALLTADSIAKKPLSGSNRAWKGVDGGIVHAMNRAGFKEWVHSPGLVQHQGAVSSMKNRKHPLCPTFVGEEFDALTLIGG